MQLSKIKNLIEQHKSGAGELVVVEGLHAIKHALRFKGESELILCRNRLELLELAQKLCPDIVAELEDRAEEVGEQFQDLASSPIRTGAIGLFHKPEEYPQNTGLTSSAVLLDDPRDLDNIGAVARVCAAAGIKRLIVSGNSNPWNSKAIRAGAGLQFALDIQHLVPADNFKPDLPLISFDERGQELNENLKKALPQKAVYVFGSERDGISKEIKQRSTKIVRLPMQDGVSSLNLATSVAAALYSLK